MAEKYKEAVKFGKLIRSLRDKRGCTQEVLAHKAGLHRAYVSTLELGYRNVTLVILCKLAKTLGVKPYELLENQ
ncbi:MAG: helix-turn-helix transcriptional regulator [Planctomycetes bacterium]|nr:helix-turn-helix transcriptional regulator [Planctomycetota bacterium]